MPPRARGRDRGRWICQRSIKLAPAWTSSRRELSTLLLGRHPRLGAGSPCAGAAGIDDVWTLIGAFALFPIEELNDRRLECVQWVEAHPLFGVAAIESSRAHGLAGLRVLSLGCEIGVDPEEGLKGKVCRVLSLAAEHCHDLRALRWEGTGGGDTDISDAIGEVFEKCRKLEVLYTADCQFLPTLEPGRTYQLTHLHLSCFIYGGPEPSDVSAWLRQMPKLRHLGLTCCAEVDGSHVLQAITADIAPNLATLDLSQTCADETWEDDEDLVRRVLSALPRGLRIAAPGSDETGYDAYDLLLQLPRSQVVFDAFERPQLSRNAGALAPYFWSFAQETRQFVSG
mmetsp:Transcript_24610/g.75885  ORF Transcript_24610/g.75885 Transcript_24610/m.75885 type:complete len:341 (-) Transcript_24610:43-1065(-)